MVHNVDHSVGQGFDWGVDQGAGHMLTGYGLNVDHNVDHSVGQQVG